MIYNDAVKLVEYHISQLSEEESKFLYVDERELDDEEKEEFKDYNMIFVSNTPGSNPQFITFNNGIIHLKDSIVLDGFNDTFAYRIESYGSRLGGYIGINKNK
jgi:hypothetical protein